MKRKPSQQLLFLQRDIKEGYRRIIKNLIVLAAEIVLAW